MKRLSLLLATLLAIVAGRAIEFKPCDLIFELSGNSAFSGAISAATHRADSLDFSHIAMVYSVSADTVSIIEASPQHGVRIVSLADFMADSPGIVIKRVKADFSPDAVLSRAAARLGEPYDWEYLPDNGKMYCSELIYEIFLDNDGAHIFTASPMNFRNEDGSMPQFWTDLFSRLGASIPEGIEGTNPNGLYKQLMNSE